MQNGELVAEKVIENPESLMLPNDSLVLIHFLNLIQNNLLEIWGILIVAFLFLKHILQLNAQIVQNCTCNYHLNKFKLEFNR